MKHQGRKLGRVVVAVAVLAAVLASAASALRFDDQSYLTPVGVVGVPYSHRFTAPPPGTSGAGCDPPYIVKVDSGALPPGLSLATNGQVSGTPTQAGAWTFWVSIKDDPTDKPWCNPLSAEREFTIEVIDRLVIGPESAPPGTVGVSYSLSMTASLSDPKTWSIPAGALPPGLALDPSSGLISGTPASAGSYTFTVQAVVDAARTDTKTLTIVVREPLSILASAPFRARTRLAHGEVGIRFRAVLTAAGGSGSYTWSLGTGTLPGGLTLGPTGTIDGRPSAAGTHRFAVSLADDENRTTTYDATISIVPRLAIDTRHLRAAELGSPYRANLRASGGLDPKRWNVQGVLPPGTHFDPHRGILAGTPRREGRYRITVAVTDSLGARYTRSFVVLVRS